MHDRECKSWQCHGTIVTIANRKVNLAYRSCWLIGHAVVEAITLLPAAFGEQGLSIYACSCQHVASLNRLSYACSLVYKLVNIRQLQIHA